METLPVEMVLKISGYLTPQDLARCCGVCRDWREMFNDDYHWRPHCDPELAEHLRNTQSVVEPVFVTPEATNNTSLTPIGHWRLAVMREEHLWKNWKLDNYKKEEFLKFEDEIKIDFLTNALVVRWFEDRIEIWDVSVTPIVFVAKTDPFVDFGSLLCRYVVGSSVLLVEQLAQIKVFDVDAVNKRVVLRHDIPLKEGSLSYFSLTRVVKDYIYVRVNHSGLSFEIVDLETGELIKNEPCPAMGNENKQVEIFQIISSPTSDIVIVTVCVPGEPYIQYHFYNLRQLAFLQRPEVSGLIECCAIHEHYFAIVVVGVHRTCFFHTVKVYNLHTLELIYNKTTNAGMEILPGVFVFNNSFIFILTNKEGQFLVEVFSPTDRKVTTFGIQSEVGGILLGTINNNILYAWEYHTRNILGLWKASGGSLKRSDFLVVRRDVKYNRALTRGMFNKNIYRYW